MKTLFAAFVLLAGAAASTPFIQQSNQFCTFQKYSGDPVINRLSCSLIPTDQTNGDGSQVFQSFYADLVPNADNTGGTFTGTIWLDRVTLVDFSGTYFGSIAPFPATTTATITSLSGSWSTGNVTSVFGSHEIGAGRYGKRTVRYLVSGSGVE